MESEKLFKILKEVTETGEWTLDTDKLKLIKSFCKQSIHNVELVFESIFAQLKKKHAQIRYSSLQLIEQLFERSKHFRDLLTDDFPVFVQLTVGIHDKKLPPPVQVATKLREYAIALIKSWYVKYSERYKQISIAYDILLDNGLLNKEGSSLSNIHANNANKANIEARRRATQMSRYELLKADVDDHLDIIKDNLTNMTSCFEILIPKNEFIDSDLDFDALLRGEASNHQTTNDSYKEDIVSHGLGSNRYKIVIDLSEESLTEDVQETEENKIVFDQLREAYTLLETKHIKQLNSWINALIKIEIPDKREKERLLKKILDVKANATEVTHKANLLHIEAIHRDKKRINSDDIEDEDEFGDELFEDIQVPEFIPEDSTGESSKLPPMQRIFPLAYEPSMIEDATYNAPNMIDTIDSTVTKDKGKQKMSAHREELLKRAPVVEWGDDLYYWDKKNVQFNTSGIERHHRFMGVGEGTNELPDHLLDQLRKRPIYYEPEIPNELPVCRHPLRNGGLCPRRDLKICPFHGPIVPRDDTGRVLNKEDEKPSEEDPNETYGVTEKETDPSIMNNLWELLETDVMDKAGHTKLKRGRKRKEPSKKSALINIRKKPTTSYDRLERQLNSKKVQKLVDESLDYEREMKSQNKEANNWK